MSDKNRITLSTGKSVYANQCIFGIVMDGDGDDGLDIYDGYDGMLNVPALDYIPSENRLTPAECVEIADRMIRSWEALRARYAAMAKNRPAGFLFRPHRGALADAMKEAREFASREELLDFLRGEIGINDCSHISCERYGFDSRIGWDTHILVVVGHCVVGFTNAAI